jgi:multimeric flavodoxin WrbA
MACKTKLEKCVLKDDLTEVLDAVAEADILVIATPIYYGEVASPVKAFIDRTFSYLLPDYETNPERSRLKQGKKLFFIQTQTHPDANQYGDVFRRYEFFLNWHGFNDRHLLVASGVRGAGDVNARSDVLKRAEEMANQLV